MSSQNNSFSIKHADIYIVALPMHTSFTTSFGTIDQKPTVLVKLTSQEEIIGWGEAPVLPFPIYKPDTTDTSIIALKNYILPLLQNKQLRHPKDAHALFASIKGHNPAKHASESALWMIFSFLKNTPLSTLFGGKQKQIPVGESIGIHSSITETLKEIEFRLSQGFKQIKIKIKPGWDISLIQQIRKQYPSISLMVDGNSAYTLKDIKLLKKLDQYSLTMIEQPLADDDIIDHASLQKMLKTPICLDESILSTDDARKALQIQACKIINIKPGRVGGVTESINIHDACKRKKCGVWCGGLLESGIGRAFNIALASLPNFIYPADMSPTSFYFKDDLIKPTFSVDHKGMINVPDSIGLGYTIDMAAIKKYLKQHIRVF